MIKLVSRKNSIYFKIYWFWIIPIWQ